MTAAIRRAGVTNTIVRINVSRTGKATLIGRIPRGTRNPLVEVNFADNRLSVIFTVIGLLLVIIGICTGTMIGLIILGAGLVELVGTIIFIAVFRRCPHCGSFLKTGCNRYCPHCGKYVDENDYIYF